MNIISVIIAAVASGLLATIITIIVQKKSETKNLRIKIFEVLMSHRYLIADKENVEALNKVEIVFHNNEEVRKAWNDFLAAADAAALNSECGSVVKDKYLKLLETIAQCIGYKNIDWENIKRFYFPQGLSTQLNEENMLRKAQLMQATESQKQDTGNGQTSSDQIAMQVVLKALDSPDGIEKLAKLAEFTSQVNK